MPCLTSEALIQDPEGLEFLKAVLKTRNREKAPHAPGVQGLPARGSRAARSVPLEHRDPLAPPSLRTSPRAG
jgi:hypothetical protein